MKMLADPKGLHVAVVGGGKTGAAAARLLLSRGARVTLFDDAPADKVNEGLKKNGLDPALVDVQAGGLAGAAIASCSFVVLSPGVPRAHKELAQAIASIPVVNELELGLAALDAAKLTIWAITGTNGKSTTTTIAGAIAKQKDPAAFVGGNLGTPLCAAVMDGFAGSILVVELSSYQLESLRAFPVHAATITNLTPDHLDRYDSAAAYYAAKAKLFDLVTKDGGVSLNAADPESRRTLLPLLPGSRMTCHFDVSQGERGVEISADGKRLVARHGGDVVEFSIDQPHIVGHHNRQNAAAAVALALLSGFEKRHIQAGLLAYAGIAHRLELVGEGKPGVRWWNDSKATNVDAAVTALKSFTSGVHLIAGGLGKGSPYAPLVDAARGKVKAVYTIGKDAEAIANAFSGVVDVVSCGDLETACARAHERSSSGDHVVLSPACASFDQFRDYAQRGERFRALCHQHQAKGGT